MILTSIEKRAIALFRQNETIKFQPDGPETIDEWLHFGLSTLLHVGQMIRSKRMASIRTQVEFKEDGSPVTVTDRRIEEFIAQELAKVSKNAVLVGEEFGGQLPDKGIAIAVDPLDGTWAFINRMDTIASSLLILKDKEPLLGMILNPISGEIAYGGVNTQGRLMQISIFGEGDCGCDLPLDKGIPESRLISIHPQRHASKISTKLYSLWQNNEINMVRSPGGSPSLALVEVAKGSSNYINLWAQKVSEPYDLAAAILILRSTGGDVYDKNGVPVEMLGHSGPFIGINGNTKHSSLLEISCTLLHENI